MRFRFRFREEQLINLCFCVSPNQIQHPGGYDVIMEHAGRDATFAFRGTGHSDEAVGMLKKFEIGILPMEERLYRHATPIFDWDGLPE